MAGFTLDPGQLDTLSQGYDPYPILQSVNDMGAGGGLQMRPGTNDGFSSFINAAPQAGGQPAPAAPAMPGFGGINPQMLSQMSGQFATPPMQPHFIGGAGLPQGHALPAPIHPQMPAAGAAGQVPSLAAILQGRR